MSVFVEHCEKPPAEKSALTSHPAAMVHRSTFRSCFIGQMRISFALFFIRKQKITDYVALVFPCCHTYVSRVPQEYWVSTHSDLSIVHLSNLHRPFVPIATQNVGQYKNALCSAHFHMYSVQIFSTLSCLPYCDVSHIARLWCSQQNSVPSSTRTSFTSHDGHCQSSQS